MKLRRVSRSLVFTAFFIFSMGVILTSARLLTLALLPLLVLALPEYPFKVSRMSHVLEGGKRVGERMKVRVEIELVGFGLVKVMHILPKTFELVDGTNAKAKFIAGRGVIRLDYTCVPLKRGSYSLGKILLEVENLLATRRVRREIGFEAEVEVRSRIYRIRRVEQRRGVAKKPVPEMDVSRIGTPGTDFREIRKYFPGDPLKFINWKATAKLGELMVNEFEREGRKAVWIFLDANSYMAHGTLKKNCFETAIEVASSLSYYFAVRGHRVGMYVVGHGILLYPESGRKQFNKIFSTLMRLDVSDRHESFDSAVDRARKYLEDVKPASIFITRAGYSSPVKAVLRAMGRKGLPVTVVSVRGELGDDLASSVVRAMERRSLRRLRALGTDVIEVDAGMPVERMVVGVRR